MSRFLRNTGAFGCAWNSSRAARLDLPGDLSSYPRSFTGVADEYQRLMCRCRHGYHSCNHRGRSGTPPRPLVYSPPTTPARWSSDSEQLLLAAASRAAAATEQAVGPRPARLAEPTTDRTAQRQAPDPCRGADFRGRGEFAEGRSRIRGMVGRPWHRHGSTMDVSIRPRVSLQNEHATVGGRESFSGVNPPFGTYFHRRRLPTPS